MSSQKKWSSVVAAGLLLNCAIGYPVFAQGTLVVDFENTPLFAEANFVPGNETTRYARVVNNAESAQDIGVQATQVLDPDGLGDILEIEITEGNTVLYANTLAAFFGAGEISLSQVAGNGAETQYDFTVRFSNTNGNTYQGKQLGFDLVLGFQRGTENSQIGNQSSTVGEHTGSIASGFVLGLGQFKPKQFNEFSFQGPAGLLDRTEENVLFDQQSSKTGLLQEPLIESAPETEGQNVANIQNALALWRERDTQEEEEFLAAAGFVGGIGLFGVLFAALGILLLFVLSRNKRSQVN